MRFRILGLAVAAGAFVLGSSAAFAGGALQACTASGYSTTYSQCSSNSNKSSTQVTAVETLKATSAQTAGLIAQRIGSFTGSAPKTATGPFRGGLSGGSKDLGIGVWANGGYSSIQYTKPDSKFNGNVWTGMGGIDYKFTDSLMVGLAAGYEATKLKTTFNNGNLDATGWTIAPYSLYKFTKNYSVDVSGGFSQINYTTDRLDPLVGTKVTGKTDADRWFVAANMNGVWAEDAWRFSAKFGTLWAEESKKAYTESNSVANAALTNSLGSVNLGGKVGYNLGMVEPFIGGTGRKWLGDANSKADFLAQGGTMLYIGELAVGTIEVSTPLGDSNLHQVNVVANIRFDF